MYLIRKISGMDILFRYERRLPYMFSDLILNSVYVRKFINLLMKDGRKYSAFKTFYSILSFIHFYFGVDPLFLISYIFSNNRVKYDVTVKKIKSNRVLYFPRFLYGPSQLFRSMHFFFLELMDYSFDVNKYYQKVGLMLVQCFMNQEIIRERIREIYKLVFQNRFRLSFFPKKASISRKSTMHYWALSKRHVSVHYRKNRRVLKRVYV